MTDHKPLTAAQIAEIEARATAATPGEWFVVGDTWRGANQSPYVLAGTDDPHGGKPICDLLVPDTLEGEDDAALDRAADEADAQAEADAAFIAAARTDIPALLSEVRRLREALETVFGEFDELINRHYGGDLPCADARADALIAARAALPEETSNGQ